MSLTTLCAEVKNYFCIDKRIGDFSIVNGVITPHIDIKNNQYYRIVGSVFNDGVHKYGDASDVLTDEATFHGAIWLMAVPRDFLELSKEIDDWNTQYGASVASPFQSESFGGYSYTKASGSGNGANATWQNAFATRLSMYRRLRP